MDKRLSFVTILSASALAWVGCDGEAPADGGPICGGDSGIICPLDGGGPDGGTDSGPEPDSGPEVCTPRPVGARASGSACRSGTQCTSPLECQDAITGMVPSVEEDGTPGPNFMLSLNTDTMCTELCELDGADSCGDCASCSNGGVVGRLTFIGGQDPSDGSSLGFCRPDCTPSQTDNGGCRDGYTCDLRTGTCVDACTDNTWCKIVGYDDLNGDGMPEFIYNPDSEATCNAETGRCEVMGTAGAVAGDMCAVDSDCMDDGLCLAGDDIPDGFCTRLDCLLEGFGCGTGETCSVRGLGGASWCLPGCTVGAEPEADRLGEAGHGMGCDPGQACSWDGRSADPNGGCVPSAYNDITTPNVGSACETNEDCYSPFGYGTCLAGGVCSVQNCLPESANGILPDITTTTRICDPAANELCVRAGGTDAAPETLCILTCSGADECSPGYACNLGILSGGTTGVCWGTCTMGSECRDGVDCVNDTGSACDADGPDNMQGTADDQECTCADLPRDPDAGMGDEDAGVDGGVDGGVDAGTGA